MLLIYLFILFLRCFNPGHIWVRGVKHKDQNPEDINLRRLTVFWCHFRVVLADFIHFLHRKFETFCWNCTFLCCIKISQGLCLVKLLNTERKMVFAAPAHKIKVGWCLAHNLKWVWHLWSRWSFTKLTQAAFSFGIPQSGHMNTGFSWVLELLQVLCCYSWLRGVHMVLAWSLQDAHSERQQQQLTLSSVCF